MYFCFIIIVYFYIIIYIYDEWNEYFEDYKWQSLTTAALYYNYSFEGQEHNSLADVFATKFVYENILTKS